MKLEKAVFLKWERPTDVTGLLRMMTKCSEKVTAKIYTNVCRPWSILICNTYKTIALAPIEENFQKYFPTTF